MPLLLYLLLGLYGLVLLATPFLVIGLYVRQARLRKQLNELAEENAKQLSRLQRAVGELQTKLAATVPPATPAPDRASSPEARQPVPVPRSFPHLQIPLPVVVSPRVEVPPPSKPQPTLPIPVTEKRPEPAAEQKPLVPAPAAPVPPVMVTAPVIPAAPPVTTSPHKSPAPAAPSESKPAEPRPVAPATQVPPPEAKPSAPPLVPPKLVPPPAVPHPPAMPPPASATIPPAAAARIATPPPTSPLRVPAAKPTFQQRMKKVSALEETLGTNWFPKLAVAMIGLGVAYFAIQQLRNLGGAGKALICFATAMLLLVGGMVIEKRERYQLLGRAGIGGGWGLLFFTAYGIQHIAAMHILDSLVLDSILMLAVALAMGAHTLRYKSQFVTGFSFLLGYTTVALSFSDVQPLSATGTNESTVYGLLAGVILAIGLVTIVLKMGWFELEVSAFSPATSIISIGSTASSVPTARTAARFPSITPAWPCCSSTG